MMKLQEKIQSQVESAISKEEALNILEGKTSLLETLYKANVEREKYFSKKVRIHILDNIKNGHCPEDCGYCAQRKNANSGVQTYSLKPEEEILEDANDWAVETMDNPKYPLELLLRVIQISLSTMKIVKNLPKLDIYKP